MPFKCIEKPVIDYSVRKLCYSPYCNHPKGCPNYGKRESCPPKAKKLENIFVMSSRIVVIWSIFDFMAHKRKMREKHPRWTQRQVECCLYWQGTARKKLKEEINRFRKINDFEWLILRCPEACGVNVTATMAKLGQQLEWPPINVTYQVALAGIYNRCGKP